MTAGVCHTMAIWYHSQICTISTRYIHVQDGHVCPCYEHMSQAQYHYLHHLLQFVASYSAVMAANFSTVFASMAVLYWKVFRRIRRMRKTQGKHTGTFADHRAMLSPFQFTEQNETTPLFGATQAMILEGQKDAKKRVFLFLVVFLITGIMC